MLLLGNGVDTILEQTIQLLNKNRGLIFFESSVFVFLSPIAGP